MECEHVHEVVEPVREERLIRLSDRAMERATDGLELRLVRHVADQDLPESVRELRHARTGGEDSLLLEQTDRLRDGHRGKHSDKYPVPERTPDDRARPADSVA